MIDSRLLYGGIDTDSALQMVENPSVMYSENVRAITQRGQSSGDIEFISGNVEVVAINNLLHGSGDVLLGKCVYAETVYLCYYHATESMIIKYDTVSGMAVKIFSSSYVSGGLGWSSTTFVDCRATDEQFFFADGGAVKYLNLGTDYSTLGVIPLSLITLITEPPTIPVNLGRLSVSGISSLIQDKAIQITYRFITDEGFTSVLSPYSLTSLPPRKSALVSDPNSGNTILVDVPTTQKIPSNWKYVEFVARYLDSNTFFVIKRYSSAVSGDVTLINNHNSGSGLFFQWSGVTLYPLSKDYYEKEFDNVPLETNRIELAANRLLLSDNVEGYDTPNVLPGFTIASNQYLSGISTEFNSSVHVYMLAGTPAGSAEGSDWYYTFVIRESGVNYLLPKDLPSSGLLKYLGVTTSGAIQNTEFYFEKGGYELPIYLSRSTLIVATETNDFDPSTIETTNDVLKGIRSNLINEANSTSYYRFNIGETSSIGAVVVDMGTIYLQDDPQTEASDGTYRTFADNTTYRVGIQYYDEELRKCGVQFLSTVVTPAYAPVSRLLLKEISITLNNTILGSIPSWAKSFSITFSPNNKGLRVINYAPGPLRVALKNKLSGEIKFGGYESLTAPENGYDAYAIAVPVPNKSEGYSFLDGDSISISGVLTSGGGITPTGEKTISGKILGVVEGYALCPFDNDDIPTLTNFVSSKFKRFIASVDTTIPASPVITYLVSTEGTHQQHKVFATIYSGAVTDQNMYEVSAFGSISGGGFEKFYDTNTLTYRLNGDHYTDKTISSTGGFVGYSYNINPGANFAINDLGRFCPVDFIGQKRLQGSIRWSNVNIVGTETNGYASFDALDYKLVEAIGGKIQGLRLTTKGIQEGGQLVIICENGSFVTLIGKRQIYGTDQQVAFTTTADVMGDINPLQGGYGTASPKSIIEYQGLVFWVDFMKGAVIQYSGEGVEVVSKYRVKTLWATMLSGVFPEITCGINPYTTELYISSSNGGSPITIIYNIVEKKWVCGFVSGGEFIGINNKLFAWKPTGIGNNKFWVDSDSAANGFCYGGYLTASLVVPFSPKFPVHVRPLSMNILSNRAPDTFLLRSSDTNIGDGEATNLGGWLLRRGAFYAAISRNRLSNNAATDDEKNASGVKGSPLTGFVFEAYLTWDAANGSLNVSAIQMNYKELSGQY